MESNKTRIEIDRPILDYNQLVRLRANITDVASNDVVLDLSRVEMMTTAAFAQFLIMKHELMQAGGNLHIQGLHDQPEALCEILKLCGLTEIGNP